MVVRGATLWRMARYKPLVAAARRDMGMDGDGGGGGGGSCGSEETGVGGAGGGGAVVATNAQAGAQAAVSV
jgi:hypothetical protein